MRKVNVAKLLTLRVTNVDKLSEGNMLGVSPYPKKYYCSICETKVSNLLYRDKFQLSSSAWLGDAAPEARLADHWSERDSFGLRMKEEAVTV